MRFVTLITDTKMRRQLITLALLCLCVIASAEKYLIRDVTTRLGLFNQQGIHGLVDGGVWSWERHGNDVRVVRDNKVLLSFELVGDGVLDMSDSLTVYKAHEVGKDSPIEIGIQENGEKAKLVVKYVGNKYKITFNSTKIK